MYVIKEVPDDTSARDEGLKQIFSMESDCGEIVKIGSTISIADACEFGHMAGVLSVLATCIRTNRWNKIEIDNYDKRLDVTEGDAKSE